MPRHLATNPTFQQHHPYSAYPSKAALRVASMFADMHPTRNHNSNANSTYRVNIATDAMRPAHLAPLRTYSPLPEYEMVAPTPCASTSQTTLDVLAAADSDSEMTRPRSCRHRLSSPESQTFASRTPSSLAEGLGVSLHQNQPTTTIAAADEHEVSPSSVSPCDPVLHDMEQMDVDMDEEKMKEQIDTADDKENIILHQPRPRRKIPILSLADLATLWAGAGAAAGPSSLDDTTTTTTSSHPYQISQQQRYRSSLSQALYLA